MKPKKKHFFVAASHLVRVLKICAVSDCRAYVFCPSSDCLQRAHFFPVANRFFRNHNFQSPKQKHSFCLMLHLFRDSEMILIWSFGEMLLVWLLLLVVCRRFLVAHSSISLILWYRPSPLPISFTSKYLIEMNRNAYEIGKLCGCSISCYALPLPWLGLMGCVSNFKFCQNIKWAWDMTDKPNRATISPFSMISKTNNKNIRFHYSAFYLSWYRFSMWIRPVEKLASISPYQMPGFIMS